MKNTNDSLERLSATDGSDVARNHAIAALLGFKQYVITVNGKPGPTAWEYPDEFRELSAGSPNYYPPDFMAMIRHKIADYDRHRYGTPMEYDHLNHQAEP